MFIFHNNIENNLSLLRNVLGTKKLGDILSERESIANEMQDLLREATEAWGVTVERVEVIQTNKQTYRNKHMESNKQMHCHKVWDVNGQC